MENKNITIYVLLGLIGFIVIIGTVNSFRTSRNLIKAKMTIDSALVLVQKSNDILKDQGLAIDQMKATNNNLVSSINTIDSTNRIMKESLIYRLNKSNHEIDSVLAVLKRIKKKIYPE